MTPTPTPGEVAYLAWAAARFPGDATHIPTPFAHVSLTAQRAWEAAAQAVQWETCQRALAVVRHWNEFGPEYDFAEKINSLELWLQARPQEPPHA